MLVWYNIKSRYILYW